MEETGRIREQREDKRMGICAFRTYLYNNMLDVLGKSLSIFFFFFSMKVIFLVEHIFSVKQPS